LADVRALRSISQVAPVAALLGALCAQGGGALRERCLAALHGQNQPPQRLNILAPRDAGNLLAPPAHHDCPLCKQPLVQVPLWQAPTGIDSGGTYTAHVCEQHAMFFVTCYGGMTWFESGPFALPAAGQKPARAFLPYGAFPGDAGAPSPQSPWVSADGTWFVADGADGHLEVRELAARPDARPRTLFREPRGAPTQMGVTACELSRDAQRIVFARSQGPLLVGDVAADRIVAKVALRGSNVLAVGIHPRGESVAFVADDGNHAGPSFRLLDVTSGTTREFARGSVNVPTYFVFLAAQQRLITGSIDGVLTAWPLAGGKPVWETKVDAGMPRHRVLLASPDEKRLLVVTRGGVHAALLDTATGESEATLTVARPMFDERNGTAALAWSADNRQFAWTIGDGRLARGDLATPGELRLHFGAAGNLGRLRFTPDGRMLLTTDSDGHGLRWPTVTFDAPR
jgi:hypothetical protein